MAEQQRQQEPKQDRGPSGTPASAPPLKTVKVIEDGRAEAGIDAPDDQAHLGGTPLGSDPRE